MAGLKSLGLAGARKALRKLFRRPLPDEDDEATTTDSSTTTQSSSFVTPSKTSLGNTEQSLQRNGEASLEKTYPKEKRQQGKHDGMAARATFPPDHGSPKRLPPQSSPQRGAGRGIISPPKPMAPRQLQDVTNRFNALAIEDLEDEDEVTKTATTQELKLPEVTEDDPEILAERAKHLNFIEEALDMARLALRTNETPVGCVLVHEDKVIARGMNATNVTRNGTRHAEFMAICALLSCGPKNGPKTTSLRPKQDVITPRSETQDNGSETNTLDSHLPDEGNEDGRKGHLYPYGQKEHPDERVDRQIIRESTLYVTVEPCIMCASLLRQLGIKKVYFGAVNDKFGGTGGVFSIHANSLPVSDGGESKSAHPMPKPTQSPDNSGTLGCSFPPSGGDGGNVEQGYEIEGGWGRDDAVGLLRRFYVQENGRAPVPRKKEGRAARLAAMMDPDGEVGGPPATAETNDEQGIKLEKDQFMTSKEHLEPSGSTMIKPEVEDLLTGTSPGQHDVALETRDVI